MTVGTQKTKILGTEWTIEFKERIEDSLLEGYDGYTDHTTKKIVICKADKDVTTKNHEAYYRETMRHEIIHAFLYESGLDTSSNNHYGAWATNEEMVDWIAIQFPKIADVFLQLGILA